MFRRILGAALAIGLTFGLASTASAAVITEYSGDGGDVLLTAGAVTAVTPHPAWGDVSDDAGLAPGTADWISYANTGVGGIIAPNTADRTSLAAATAHFQRSFSTTGGQFDLWVLTDDTASVWLDGVEIFPVFLGQIDPCAPGGTGVPVGCVEADMGVFSINLAAGNHTLDFYAYQTNNDVFGAQYAFSYQQVPEPEVLGMLGMGLFGLGALARRRSRTAAA